MELEEIIKYLNELVGSAEFVGKADQHRIKLIEQKLHVRLPESYKWFLKEHGHALIPGIEIYGSGLADEPSCVKSTIDWREYGLADHFVVIQDVGEWIYCLDTSRLHNGECPVVDWDQLEGVGNEFFDSFLTFFKIRLKESLDIK